jgi:hypothetical protein
MVNREVLNRRTTLTDAERGVADRAAHPAWLAFIRYCVELQHGEIEVLKIQDGLPVMAEVVRKKIKFAS